ncbi:hypothetical protein F1721_09000 [Saccharopolyspora hirsuta]|uniref:Uncharacterized protein n=1 Tax=Saccharopolyspora hirsuta TaxID=1837 RepID=A0A5M7BZN8_SACHI|nr:hypothetical protein [Saccharopolyspora hirsuta]KAA5834943.1 hypothetical protein F1721_09000 [Saccharopolyspora hirsuta]
MSSAGCPTLDNLDDGSTAFLFEAVDLGMEYAKFEDGFVPLATVLGPGGQKHIWKLVGDEDGSWTQEQGVALGREKLHDLDEDAHCVTLIYDGYFTGDGGRTEAVFVEAYQLGRPAGVHMCQRYERRGGDVHLIGNPMLLDDVVPPLVSPDRQPVEYPHLGPEAKEFALGAIAVGIEDVEPEACVVQPFAAVLAEDGSRDLWRLVDDELDPTVGGSLDLGRDQLASLDRSTRCAALVWGGDIPDDEDQEGAVFVEAYELGRPAGVRLVQPYRRIDHDRVALLGGPQVLEESEPLVPPVEAPRSEAFARLQEMAARKRS